MLRKRLAKGEVTDGDGAVVAECRTSRLPAGSTFFPRLVPVLIVGSVLTSAVLIVGSTDILFGFVP